MPFELLLALRYLRMRRGRRLVKWTATAAVLGIACGVAALILAFALANGFRQELRDKILRGTAHVTVARSKGLGVSEAKSVAQRTRTLKRVTNATPTMYEGTLLSGPAGTGYAIVRGIDTESRHALETIQQNLKEGSIEPLIASRENSSEHTGDAKENEKEASTVVPIIVGRDLAARTGLNQIGATGWVVASPNASNSLGTIPRTNAVRVAGVFDSGLYEYDSTWIYASLADASRITSSFQSLVVSIEIDDLYAARDVATELRQLLGSGWTVVDWSEANRPLFAALELERRTIAIIIALIMLIAALNITTMLALVVVERRAEIAVLNTIGAEGRSITAIFVIEGAIIGAAGSVAGIILGLAVAAVANQFGLVKLPPDVYSISSITLRPQVAEVLVPALVALIVSILATLYPAYQAARLRPAEALRNE